MFTNELKRKLENCGATSSPKVKKSKIEDNSPTFMYQSRKRESEKINDNSSSFAPESKKRKLENVQSTDNHLVPLQEVATYIGTADAPKLISTLESFGIRDVELCKPLLRIPKATIIGEISDLQAKLRKISIKTGTRRTFPIKVIGDFIEINTAAKSNYSRDQELILTFLSNLNITLDQMMK